MAYVFDDQPATGAQNTAPRFVFEDEQQAPATGGGGYVFEDAAEIPAAPAPKQKGILESAADVFIGAGARIAQGVNEGLGAINKGFGLDSSIYDEGAAYWDQKADEVGSSGLPAKIYQGIGAAPAGVAEFMAGPVYAGAKGAAEGYRESGTVAGTLEKAAIEVGKRVAIGKVFHGIENTGVSGLPKAAAMGGTMGVQTAAEQAMTDQGIQPQDVAASTITGTLLSISGRSGQAETVRQNLLKDGVQPDIAADLAGRVQESPRFVFDDPQAEPARREMEIIGPEGQRLEVPPDTRPPETIGPLVAEAGTGRVTFAPESDKEMVAGEASKFAPGEANVSGAPVSLAPVPEIMRENPPLRPADASVPVPQAGTAANPLEVVFHPDKRVELRFSEPLDPKTVNLLQGNRFKDQGEGIWIAKGDGKARRQFVETLQNEMREQAAFPEVGENSVEPARQAAAGTLNQVYPEGSPNIGLAVKPAVVRDDAVTIPRQHADQEGKFTSADSAVEKRWKAANGLADGPGLIERGKAFIHRMLSETNHFPELDTTNFAGKRTADILRRFESSAAAAKAKTAEHLHGLTATFGPKKMDIFTRKVILDDLMNEADKGRALPFGYTPESLRKDHAAVTAITEAHPDIKAAIERRADVNKALVMDLVENDLLPVESVLKPEALERYQKSGRYEADDINTGYFRHQVLEHANARRWAGISTAGDVRNKQRGWQKGREGSEKDINTNFLEASYEVFSQSLKELATKKTLDETLQLNDIAPELKARAKKEGVGDWKTLIPEGYTAWQPEKGSIFYRGQTMPEQIISRFIEENPHFADVAAKSREVTILGGKKAEAIIPEGLAKTLDGLRTNRETATLDTVNQKLIGAWKVWTLLSPRRALRYNLNNASSDWDVAMAADPAILKHFNTAWRNALNRKAGRAMSKDEIDMLERGVIDAGISINEIPDINKLPGFSRLSEAGRRTKLITALRSGDLSKLAPPNVIAKYFDLVSGLTQIREGLIREAAYLRAKELLEQGKKVYWASKPAEIDALPHIKDKAAKLSRELLGDYGNLSAHGEKIRSRFIPFWSWMEINSPRYYRLFKNAAARGEAGSTAARMAGVGTRKAAGAALGVAEKVLLTQILFASVSAFNHLVHPEEEERLGDADRKQLHIILGTDSDGKVLTARFQGAFSDALSWFGLENYSETLRNLKDGKMTSGELAKKMLMATPNKLANAAAPFYKLGAEIITGKSFYPDITKPMPIRDKVEHAARFLSLDEEYKVLAGKPSRGYLDGLKKTLLYESDPGEQAYNNIRQQAAKFLEKNGKEMAGGEPTERSNALYYYKQALRYGDDEAAAKYKQQYLSFGGTVEGMTRSIERAKPMAMIPVSLRYKFRSGLSEEDKATLERANEWYRQVYLGR